MAVDHALLRRLYAYLLSLYPRAFRARFADSMMQTFIDLCRDRKRQNESVYTGYVVWLLFETALGAAKENVAVIKGRPLMKVAGADVRSAGIVSTLLVLPLLVLELTLGRANGGGVVDRFVLFGFLWLVAGGFMLVLSFLLRSGQMPKRAWRLFAGVAAFALLVFVWGSLVVDQFPCFLGVPNCD